MKKYRNTLSLYIFLISSMCLMLIGKSYYTDINSLESKINLIHKVYQNDLTDALILENKSALKLLLSKLHKEGQFDSVSHSLKVSKCGLFCKSMPLAPSDSSLGHIKYEYFSKLVYSNIFTLFLVLFAMMATKKAFVIHSENNKHIASTNLLKEKDKIAKQVYHDISSPLTSLEHIIESINKYVPEPSRVVLREVTTRIHDIINNLSHQSDAKLSSQSKKQAISPLLKKIIAEKRIEYKNDNNIIITFKNNLDYKAFSRVSPSELSRAISNIINNAIEARVPEKPLQVMMSCEDVGNSFKISIEDNGIGIPAEKIKNIFNRGESYNKENGQGLGLSQAKEYIEKVYGNISIKSKEGYGTIVIVTIEKVSPPSWVANSLKITKNRLCIIDDDNSIHSTWSNILKKYPQVNVAHIKSSSDFDKWALDKDLNDYQYLFDLELLNSDKNGLDIIEKYNLGHSSTLVTSHYSDESVQQRATSLSVKIIPKISVRELEIYYESPELPKREVVLIDDDKLVHDTWEMVALNRGISVYCYYDIDTFLNESNEYSHNTPIYIDSNLNNNIKGEIEAEKLYKKGFQNLHISSGSKLESLPNWIKSQQGKEFPLH